MTELNSFEFNGHRVYNLEDLIAYDEAYFYGCLKRKRNVLKNEERFRIEGSYFFAKQVKSRWEESTEKYSKANILVKYEWAHSHVTKLVDCGAVGGARERNYGAVGGGVEVPLRKAPSLIFLEEYEKFRDDEGNIFEVEVRGVRDVKKIFFMGRDLEKLFKMEHLIKNVPRDGSGFAEGQHYVYFLVDIHYHSEDNGSSERKRVRRMFFTFLGLMHVIFRSNSGIANRFQLWATEILYTARLGTPDQRIEQAIEMLGVNAGIVKEVFKTCVAKVPCVYLFHIGKIMDMKKHYPDDLNQYKSGMLFKYGRTENLSRRLGEHMGTFGTLEGSRFELSYWSPINVNNVVTAESQLSTFFDAKKIAFLDHVEVVLLKKSDLKSVKEKYLEIYNDLGIVCDMVAIVQQNEKLISDSQAQKLLLEEKDKMVVHLNLQIKMLNSERQVWNEENERWLDREKEWFVDKQMLIRENERLIDDKEKWQVREEKYQKREERLEKRVKKVTNAYRNQTSAYEELSEYCVEMQKEHEFELSHVQEQCKADFDNLEIVYLAGDISNLCLDTQYESD